MKDNISKINVLTEMTLKLEKSEKKKEKIELKFLVQQKQVKVKLHTKNADV